jgi:HEAT repeat protein
MTRTLILMGLGCLLPVNATYAQRFLGKSALEWQDSLLKANDAKVQRNAAFALGKLGGDAEFAVPDLVRQLQAKEPNVREAAAFALGSIAKDYAARAAARVEATHKDLRRQQALAELAGKHLTLVPALQAALKTNTGLVRRSAAFALGCLEQQAVPALKDLADAMSDTNAAVRQNVAWALGQTKSKDSRLALQKGLHDNDPQVRRDAAGAMGQLPDDAIRPVLDDLVQACAPIGNVRPEIMAEVRKPALRALVKVISNKDQNAAKGIRIMLKDADPEVRLNAALVLAKVGGAEARDAIAPLHAALKSTDPNIRGQAAVGLGNIGAEAATKAVMDDLIRLLSDPETEVRRLTALGLGDMGKLAAPAVPRLAEVVASRSESPAVRVQAATALSFIGDVPAAAEQAPKLVRVLASRDDNIEVRKRVIWALRVHNVSLEKVPGAIDTFVKILDEPKGGDETKMLFFDSAYMLGMLRGAAAPPKTMDVLLDFLKDATIQIFVGTGAKGGGTGAEVKGADLKVLETGQGDGRIMAVQALGNIGAAVRNRADIIQELQVIANNENLWTKLRDDAKTLLKSLGK